MINKWYNYLVNDHKEGIEIMLRRAIYRILKQHPAIDIEELLNEKIEDYVNYHSGTIELTLRHVGKI